MKSYTFDNVEYLVPQYHAEPDEENGRMVFVIDEGQGKGEAFYVENVHVEGGVLYYDLHSSATVDIIKPIVDNILIAMIAEGKRREIENPI